MASSTNSRIPQIAKVRCRGIVVHCQQPGAFLLKEVRGSQIEYFLEPGSIRVRREYAEEAVRSGWLMIRDRDLFGQPMTWAYRAKPAPKTSTQFSRPAITARKTTTPR